MFVCHVCVQTVRAECSDKFCVIQKFIITDNANSNALEYTQHLAKSVLLYLAK